MKNKAFYKSSGFWGIVLAALGSFEFGQTVINTLGLTAENATGLVDKVLLYGGLILGLLGRKKATQPLGLKDS